MSGQFGLGASGSSPPMEGKEELACSVCGRPAADEKAFVAARRERRPCVSPSAKAFTCSRCLMGAGSLQDAAIAAGGVGVRQGRRAPQINEEGAPGRVVAGTPGSRTVSALRGRAIQVVNRDGSVALPGHRGRPGRPRVDEAVQRRKSAARAASYRERKKRKRIEANDALMAGGA
jgi:hypothetical protein